MKKILFSLVELMVTLIIISVVISALTPAITKRIKTNKINITDKTVIQGSADTNTSEEVEEIDCTTFDSKCTECTKTACTKCSLGYELKDNLCDTYCKGDNLAIIEDLCVTTCNMGDCGLPMTYTDGTCWTSTGGTCVDTDSSYSGCNRKLCNWTAAKQVCHNAEIQSIEGWRLPTAQESENWHKYSEMRLCDYQSGYSNNSCTVSTNCTGSWSNKCVAADIWTSEQYSDTRSGYRGLSRKVFNWHHDVNYYAFSVRCVRELK